MSDFTASVEPTSNGFAVCGYEKIDLNIYNLYGEQIQQYFDHYAIEFKVHKTMIGEMAKSMETMLSIVDSMTEFGVYRKEPVLVVGGGLVTDVAGVIAYGHTWSPTHELVPDPPLRHGHAISVDMAFSATLSLVRGKLSEADHQRLLNLFSRAGLAIDHVDFDEKFLATATAAILKTRNGQLRAVVPVSPMGVCTFLNDVTHEEMCEALKFHKNLVNDTGYTLDGQPIEGMIQEAKANDDKEIYAESHEFLAQPSDLRVQA
ncbi:2-epi-5-epi-valiolone synthase [Cordyceps fumosorosea ARSEF 2679]|uniref:2-epi-5-epi-valiolone synthase n=1 Tax=Cordyceps fumosorosea (strain ARSEF 2679) TaxID=1081104 RepID=A0A168EUE4_CORFA|nr:2-epi-5-epi-valiolone synthase [Cordyceps fumosorosea ARSEF 2679]OAA74237.1 2-epi-5-epi-valiolone synthase [Cordyceps fumosorosea ARSEF 2679]